MNKDIMSYCGDDILDAADRNWNRADKTPLLRRITVAAAVTLLTAGLIAAAIAVVSKLNEKRPPVIPDTTAAVNTEAGIQDDTTDEWTNAGVVIPDESEKCGDETRTPTESDLPEATEAEGITYSDKGERPIKTVVNYKDYLDFLAQTDSYVKITEYESVKITGKFKSFIILSDDYSQYRYSFDDGSGFTVNLTVTDLSVRGDNRGYETVDPSQYTSDLRALNGTGDGIRNIDGIEYMYVKGKLLWICFKDGDTEYKFSGDSMLDGYPKNADTFMSKLLTAETAAYCINTLKADLKGGNK